MERIYLSFLAVSLFIMFGMSSCPPNNPVQQIADSLPPAKTPIIYNTEGLVRWNNDQIQNYVGIRHMNTPRGVSDDARFVLYVELGASLNQLIIKENNKEIEDLTDKNVPSPQAYYLSEDVTGGGSSGRWRRKITIITLALISPTLKMKTNVYELFEKSNNPKYKGTPDEVSPPNTFEVTIVDRGPTINSFDCTVMQNKSAIELNFMAAAKQVTISRESEGTIYSKDSGAQPILSLFGKPTVSLNNHRTFTLTAYNALKQQIQQKCTAKDPQQTPQPLCPNNQNPQYYTFCLVCPSDMGDYKSEFDYVAACSEQDGKNAVQQQGTNCTVQSGTCW
jgi:hypothetical protein